MNWKIPGKGKNIDDDYGKSREEYECHRHQDANWRLFSALFQFWSSPLWISIDWKPVNSACSPWIQEFAPDAKYVQTTINGKETRRFKFPILFYWRFEPILRSVRSMFIGHYGIAFALKKYAPKISLGLLFIAAQLADIVFFILVPLGIEQLRIIPGFTEASPFELYNYPITHSLVGALAWTIATFLVVRFIPLKNLGDASSRQRSALVLSAVVFSHFILDFIVHTPDLVLVPGFDIKIGLGLWNSIIATVASELAILLLGCWMYIRSTSGGEEPAGKYGMYAFMIVLAGIAILTPFMTFPDVPTVVIMSELLYAVFALAAWWLDGKRQATENQV